MLGTIKEEKGATEDEMVRQYHRLNGYEFEQALGHSEGQGVQRSVGSQRMCFRPQGHKTQTQINNSTTTKIPQVPCYLQSASS